MTTQSEDIGAKVKAEIIRYAQIVLRDHGLRISEVRVEWMENVLADAGEPAHSAFDAEVVIRA
jgi:hypothetical protein